MMEERITIKKESMLKDLVLGGLQEKGFLLIQETGSQYPIKVYHNKPAGMIALYDSVYVFRPFGTSSAFY